MVKPYNDFWIYIRVNKWKNSNIGLTPELANLTHFWRNDFHAVSTKYNLDQKKGTK